MTFFHFRVNEVEQLQQQAQQLQHSTGVLLLPPTTPADAIATLSLSVAVSMRVLVGELVSSITLLGEAEKLTITGGSLSLDIQYIYVSRVYLRLFQTRLT